MKEAEKVIITRPTVSKEEIGFLPGDLREKMDPWVQPIYQNMSALYAKVKVEQLKAMYDFDVALALLLELTGDSQSFTKYTLSSN